MTLLRHADVTSRHGVSALLPMIDALDASMHVAQVHSGGSASLIMEKDREAHAISPHPNHRVCIPAAV
jgi:hypothetical protein